MNYKKDQKGFSLIELLVVIAIIGILTTLITSNLSQAQQRARDGRRKSDLRVIAQGLEMYYSQNNTYPTKDNLPLNGSTLTDTTGQLYIKNIPKDPRNTSGSYEYYYCTAAPSGSRILQFNLFAKLENTNDKDVFCGTSKWADTSCELTAGACSTGSAGGSNLISTIVGTTANAANYVVTDP